MCDQCGNEPCTCQKALAVKEKRQWLIQTCSEPGCTVVIRSLPGEQEAVPICKWHKAGNAYNTRPRLPILPDHGPTMSKEEFGLDLYDAIRLNAGRLQCERMGQTERAKALAEQLQRILEKNTIEPPDLKRLLAMHN